MYCVGLAYDYCVGFTAIDAKKKGFKVYVVKEATRAVAKESEEGMTERLEKEGVEMISAGVL